jgi:hypothetical protein
MACPQEVHFTRAQSSKAATSAHLECGPELRRLARFAAVRLQNDKLPMVLRGAAACDFYAAHVSHACAARHAALWAEEERRASAWTGQSRTLPTRLELFAREAPFVPHVPPGLRQSWDRSQLGPFLVRSDDVINEALRGAEQGKLSI